MLNLIASAIKAKAPIVAIPVEGHAPVCLNRKRLAAWSKGVTVTAVKLLQFRYVQEKPLDYKREGPLDMGPVNLDRFLIIKGYAGKVKVTAKFIPIDRRAAVKELSAWAEKERERRIKRILLGALSPEKKKALKMAKYEGTGDGITVEIPELPLLRFIVVRVGSDDGEFTFKVNEVKSGRLAGSGATAEAAILKARQKALKLSPEAIIKLQVEIMALAVA